MCIDANYKTHVQMFKEFVPIGPKRICELVELLKGHVDIIQIESHDLPGHVVQSAYYNAAHSALNAVLRFLPDNMSFLMFQVVQNDKSKRYFAELTQDTKTIYVIFENNTGYITSNSDLLFIELELARGVSQEDYDAEGIQFRSIISHLAIAYSENKCVKDLYSQIYITDIQD